MGCRRQHFCSMNYHLARCLTVLARPVRAIHGKIIVATGTRMGCDRYMVQLASGHWREHVLNIASQLYSEAVLRELGFSDYKVHSEDDDPCMSMVEEDMLARYCMDFIVCLAGQRVLTCMHYTSSVPLRSFQLLHPCEKETAKALDVFKMWWDVLSKAEGAAHSNPVLSGMLDEVIWRRHQDARIMVELAEHEWKCVPPGLATQLRHAAAGPILTKVAEDGVRHVRNAENRHCSRRLCRVQRQIALADCPVLPDADYPKIPTTAAARAYAKD